MNNVLESMTSELNKKAELFKKQADQYANGQLVYTITCFCSAIDNEDKEVNVAAPLQGQKCFGDFFAAYEKFLEFSEQIAANGEDWDCFVFSKDRGGIRFLCGCLFYDSLKELEEEIPEKLSNLGESESRSFAICDFFAQSYSGKTCILTLHVTNASLEDYKSEPLTEILTSDKYFEEYCIETKELLYSVCEKAEKFEKVISEKEGESLCFIVSCAVINTDENAAQSFIYPSNFIAPYYTNFKRAFSEIIDTIIASVGPLETMDEYKDEDNEDYVIPMQSYNSLNTSKKNINIILEKVRNGKTVNLFTYIRDNSGSYARIINSLSVCRIDK